MKALDMDISQLKRHHDASGKYCPTNMLQQPALWQDFVNQVQVGLNED
jgi:N-acetylmuramoyl-L-alanine amidase CwlA